MNAPRRPTLPQWKIDLVREAIKIIEGEKGRRVTAAMIARKILHSRWLILKSPWSFMPTRYNAAVPSAEGGRTGGRLLSEYGCRYMLELGEPHRGPHDLPSLKLWRARAVCNEVVSRCNTRLAVDKPSRRTVYCLHQQRTFRDRAARGSVHLRKMVCRAVAGINIVRRSKVIDAR